MPADKPIATTVLGYPQRTPDQLPRRVQGIQNLAQWKNSLSPLSHDGEGTLPDTAWLRRAIGSLFQSFVTMALPGQPAAEMLPHTAQLWVDILADMNLTEEQDRDRIATAGRVLLRKVTEWPQVAVFIAELPPRVSSSSDLPATPVASKEERQAAKKRFRDIGENL